MPILEMTFRDVEKTPEIEELIKQKTARLDKVFPDLMSCRISVEKPQKHQRSGSPFRVRIEMGVPGDDIMVTRESGEGDMHEPLSKIVNQAFTVARRRLREAKERREGRVKTHPAQEVMAVVGRMFREQGYGFILTPEGREIYFHRNAVLNDDFARLTSGTGVRFTEEMGTEGPQASTVQIVDKPGVIMEKVEKGELKTLGELGRGGTLKGRKRTQTRKHTVSPAKHSG